jgi:hypothetical protein
MTPLDLIKQGIINKNWLGVAEGYKKLTGEDIPVENDASNSEFILNSIRQLLAGETKIETPEPTSSTTTKKKAPKTVKKKIEEPRVSNISKKEALSILLNDQTTPHIPTIKENKEICKRGTGEVNNSKRKMQMPFADSQDAELAAVAQVLKTPKRGRDPYEAKMVNCVQCGTPFDFNKEYPGTAFENNQLKCLCGKCLIR